MDLFKHHLSVLTSQSLTLTFYPSELLFQKYLYINKDSIMKYWFQNLNITNLNTSLPS